jgi:hypothetical protein
MVPETRGFKTAGHPEIFINGLLGGQSEVGESLPSAQRPPKESNKDRGRPEPLLARIEPQETLPVSPSP